MLIKMCSARFTHREKKIFLSVLYFVTTVVSALLFQELFFELTLSGHFQKIS